MAGISGNTTVAATLTIATALTGAKLSIKGPSNGTGVERQRFSNTIPRGWSPGGEPRVMRPANVANVTALRGKKTTLPSTRASVKSVAAGPFRRDVPPRLPTGNDTWVQSKQCFTSGGEFRGGAATCAEDHKTVTVRPGSQPWEWARTVCVGDVPIKTTVLEVPSEVKAPPVASFFVKNATIVVSGDGVMTRYADGNATGESVRLAESRLAISDAYVEGDHAVLISNSGGLLTYFVCGPEVNGSRVEAFGCEAVGGDSLVAGYRGLTIGLSTDPFSSAIIGRIRYTTLSGGETTDYTTMIRVEAEAVRFNRSSQRVESAAFLDRKFEGRVGKTLVTVHDVAGKLTVAWGEGKSAQHIKLGPSDQFEALRVDTYGKGCSAQTMMVWRDSLAESVLLGVVGPNKVEIYTVNSDHTAWVMGSSRCGDSTLNLVLGGRTVSTEQLTFKASDDLCHTVGPESGGLDIHPAAIAGLSVTGAALFALSAALATKSGRRKVKQALDRCRQQGPYRQLPIAQEVITDETPL